MIGFIVRFRVASDGNDRVSKNGIEQGIGCTGNALGLLQRATAFLIKVENAASIFEGGSGGLPNTR